jgi:hypothetical protein
MSPHTEREKSRKAEKQKRTFDFPKKKEYEYARDETRATFLFIEKENR